MQLFSELKRRNVLRMAVLYAVAAWLIMQVAGVLIDLGGLPAWSGRIVIWMLALGLPIALVFSWIYEITPEGIEREVHVHPDDSIAHVTGRRMDFVVISLLSAALILFAYDKWWPQEPLELSIAVLPFTNMSDDPEQEYFSDGISEEILNTLAQIQTLKVIARTSSFSFKDKDADIATIAEQLGVRHILEGSVRRSGDQVRITAQLIDASDSSHLWSQNYDREYSAETLFAIQSDVARSITDRLRMTLTEPEQARLANVPTENTEAYAAYLLGRERLRDRKVAELADAVEQFSRATELDPNFAGAWSGLADACYLYASFTNWTVYDGCPAKENDHYGHDLEVLARKAIELDPELGEGYVSLGMLLHSQLFGYASDMPLLAEAHAAFERGLELSPQASQAYNWYALSLPYTAFYPDEPHGWMEAWRNRKWQSVIDKGLEVDPLSLPLLFTGSRYPVWVSITEKAMQRARRAIEIAPDSPRGYEILANLRRRLEGRVDESIKWLSEALRRDPVRVGGMSEWFGRLYSALGDFEKADELFSFAEIDRDTTLDHAFVMLYLGERAKAIEALESMVETLGDDDGQRHRLYPVLATLAAIDLKQGHIEAAAQRFDGYRDRCRNLPEDPTNCIGVMLRLAQLTGDEDEFLPIFEEHYQDEILPWIEVYGSGAWLGVARMGYLSTFGRHEEALQILEGMSVTDRLTYWTDRDWHFFRDYDPMLDGIRDDPRFEAAYAEVEAEMARQLEHVRQMELSGEVVTIEELRAMRE